MSQVGFSPKTRRQEFKLSRFSQKVQGRSLNTVSEETRSSRTTPPYPYYPYWNGQFTERNPPPV